MACSIAPAASARQTTHLQRCCHCFRRRLYHTRNMSLTRRCSVTRIIIIIIIIIIIHLFAITTVQESDFNKSAHLVGIGYY